MEITMNVNNKLYKKYNGKVKASWGNDKIILTGNVNTWTEKVEAGLLVSKAGSKIHVVNDISCNEEKEEEMLISNLKDEALDGENMDVLVIGGGVVGCAILRELSKYDVKTILVEKEYDVALHASSRNDGMVHPGLDIKPGLLKKKLNNKGNKMYDELCEELNVKFERFGQYLCLKYRLLYIPALFSLIYFNLTAAGKTQFLGRKKLLKREPMVSDEAKCALYFGGAGSVCPYNLTIALAENAIENGAKVSLDTAVLGMEVKDKKIKCVNTNRGKIYPKVVINAAGVFSEDVAYMAGDRFFSLHPRKGTNSILDKEAKKNINTIYSLLGEISKNSHTKGGGVVSTVDGNVLVGPNAIETYEKENFETDKESIDEVFSKQKKAAYWLNERDIITYFTGVRAATYEEDFIVEKGRNVDNIIHAAGIQSPGLTAAPAIAVEIVNILEKMMPDINKKSEFKNNLSKYPHVSEMGYEERIELINQNPDYGEIVCRCEEVSKGEILDAMRRPLECYTVDGIKRRTRPGMGRCQGGFCGPQVVKLISEELGIELNKVRKGYENSKVLAGEKNEI